MRMAQFCSIPPFFSTRLTAEIRTYTCISPIHVSDKDHLVKYPLQVKQIKGNLQSVSQNVMTTLILSLSRYISSYLISFDLAFFAKYNSMSSSVYFSGILETSTDSLDSYPVFAKINRATIATYAEDTIFLNFCPSEIQKIKLKYI